MNWLSLILTILPLVLRLFNIDSGIVDMILKIVEIVSGILKIEERAAVDTVPVTQDQVVVAMSICVAIAKELEDKYPAQVAWHV